METYERFKKFVDSQGIRKEDMVKKIGISLSAFHNFYYGRSFPSVSSLESLLKAYPDLNVQWLLSGKGPMYLSQVSDPKDIEDLKKRINLLMGEVETLKEKAGHHESLLKKRNEKIESLEAEVKNLNQRKEKLKSRLEGIREENAILKANLEGLSTKLAVTTESLTLMREANRIALDTIKKVEAFEQDVYDRENAELARMARDRERLEEEARQKYGELPDETFLEEPDDPPPKQPPPDESPPKKPAGQPPPDDSKGSKTK